MDQKMDGLNEENLPRKVVGGEEQSQETNQSTRSFDLRTPLHEKSQTSNGGSQIDE